LDVSFAAVVAAATAAADVIVAVSILKKSQTDKRAG